MQQCARPDRCWPSPFRGRGIAYGFATPIALEARRILKTTPGSWRGSDGEVQEEFSATAGPARRERKARSVGSTVHRAGGNAVRSGIVLGYGGLRTVERGVVAAFPAPGAWYPEIGR